MYTKISKSLGRNKGSCKGLIEYLDKDVNTYFFDKNGRRASLERVTESIDKNVHKLTKEEDKFYMLSFSPSAYELEKMVGRKVGDFDELSKVEKAELFMKLKEFTGEAMDIYAKNFNRENVKDRQNLVYFGRIETSREYHHYDKEVREGVAKTGDKKEGLNVHIHVVVSRKSADMKTKLSPNMKFRNHKLENMNTTRGFNYNDFTALTHEKFRDMFNIRYAGNNYDYTRRAKLNITNRRAGGYAKAKMQNIVLQNEFYTERRMADDTMKAAKFIRLAVHANNPAGLAKEAVREIVKQAQKIHQISMGL